MTGIPIIDNALIPRRFTCFEYRGRMLGGSTAPHRVVGVDENGVTANLILKLRSPGTATGHHEGTSLACELMFAVIARSLGLDVPDYSLATVGPIFASGISDGHVSGLFSRNVGLNFATVHMLPQPSTWEPRCTRLSLDLRAAVEEVLAFDATIFNGDRKTANPNLLWDGADRVTLIDHGLACPASRWDDPTIAQSPTFPDGETQAHSGFMFLQGHGRHFDSIAARWAQLDCPPFWGALRAILPREWEQRPGDVDRMFRFLQGRAARFGAVTAELRRVVR